MGLVDLNNCGLIMVNAEIFYQVEYLEKGTSNLGTVQNLCPGLAPDMTETQRNKMKRL